MTKFQEEKQTLKVSQLRRKEEEAMVVLLAEKYHIPHADLSTIPINVDALAIVREHDARTGELAVVQRTGKKLEVGVRNPELPKTKAVLEELTTQGYHWDLFLVSRSSLERAWSFYASITEQAKAITGEVEVSSERLAVFRSEVRSFADIERVLGGIASKRTTDILEVILAGALETDSSDIHLEPQEETVRIRYRLDGVLNDVATLTRALYKFLLSRVKLISEMKLNVQNRGQDGRFTIRLEGLDIEIRTSTLPGPYGENIVMRVLNPKAIGVGFPELGMQPWTFAAVARELGKPNGMIVTTGPTGSGKTTTLYSFIREVHKPGIKLITLEDPIEYHLTGIEQTQVDPAAGYDFANGLRSILRQDPDVILVGEIRDLETAHTAMHAALTGHLVFSTLHTNNAAGTIPRLLDLGVDPAIVAPAINIAIAQRLVRKLCERCKRQVPATDEETEHIRDVVASLPPRLSKPNIPAPLMLAKPVGCGQCHLTGYRRRIGVFEVIVVDDRIELLIPKKPTEVEIKRVALGQNQTTMYQDGILKVLAGITDLGEVERVVGSE